VDAGTVLFRIDPDKYVLAVRRAEAQLEAIGQSIGASTAAVATAQAKLVEALAKRENVRDPTTRTLELVKKGIYPEARRAQAQAALDSAEAIVAQAEAELEKARQTSAPRVQPILRSATPWRSSSRPISTSNAPPSWLRPRAVWCWPRASPR
jgi:multidrug resistance efflux pump